MNEDIQMKIHVLYILLAGFILFSCKKKETDPSFYAMETEYFGWEKGRFVEYNVTAIFHDSLLNIHDTTNYQLKAVITDTFIDNSGRIANEYHRYTRNNSSEEWIHRDVWTGIIADNKAQLVEENQRIVKMIFKPRLGDTWNSNMYNLDEHRKARYTELNTTRQSGGFYFPKTASVEFYKYKTLIDDRYESEVYAFGIGMIEKKSRNLYYKFGNPVPVKGTETYYTVTGYGKQ